MKRKYLTFFLLFYFFINVYGQKFSVGIGFNKQYHRMNYLKEDLAHEEVNKQFLVSPTLYLACKINKKFSIAVDITYLKFNKAIRTNINFKEPGNKADDVTTLNYEKVPIAFAKVNYKLYRTKKEVKIFVSTGCSFSHQNKSEVYNGTIANSDSTVSGMDINDRPSYTRINYLIGAQVNIPLSDKISVNFSLNNVFGGKKYLFKQHYDLTGIGNERKQLEYGLFGGFVYFDFKLAYNFTNK